MVRYHRTCFTLGDLSQSSPRAEEYHCQRALQASACPDSCQPFCLRVSRRRPVPHKHTSIHTCVYVYIYIYICICTCVPACMCMYIHTYIYVYISLCVYIHPLNVCICIHTICGESEMHLKYWKPYGLPRTGTLAVRIRPSTFLDGIRVPTREPTRGTVAASTVTNIAVAHSYYSYASLCLKCTSTIL